MYRWPLEERSVVGGEGRVPKAQQLRERCPVSSKPRQQWKVGHADLGFDSAAHRVPPGRSR